MKYGIVETEEFYCQLRKFGDIKKIDDALFGVKWALANNPEVYECVVGDIRVLKTNGQGVLPPLSIRFRVRGEQVFLLHLECTRGPTTV